MSNQSRVEIVRTDRQFEIREPLYEEFLCFGSEAKPCRILSVQLHQLAEDQGRHLLRSHIGCPVHVGPIRLNIGPHQNLEPLNESVVAGAVCERSEEHTS